jgi:uncharacterized protein involved in outer membrane biogenesis
MADKTPNARKGFSRWLFISGGLALLLGVAVLAAPFLVPWNRVKDQLTATVSKTLGRELKVGGIEVGLFSGVHVKDISLANAAGPGFSRQPLFSVADAKLRISLLSLLTGKLVIRSIVFKRPAILVETNADGLSNLAGLGSSSSASSAEAAPVESSASGSMPVLVTALVIEDGSLTLRDKKAGKPDQSLEGLDLRLTGLSLAAAGASRLELSLDYSSEGKKIPVKLLCDFRLDLGGDRISFERLNLNAPALTVQLRGGVEKLRVSPSADLVLQAGLDLGALPQLLPPSALKAVPGGLKTSGGIALEATVKGPLQDPAKLDMRVDLAFNGVTASYGDYPALSGLQGKLSVTPAGAELPALNFKLGGDPATLALKARWGSLANVMNGPARLKAEVDLRLQSPKLNLEPILTLAMREDTPEEAKAKAAKVEASALDTRLVDYRDKVPAGLHFRGRIAVDSMVAKTLKTGALSLDVTLKDRKLQSTSSLKLYDGEFWERSGVDFNVVGPRWSSQVGLSRLDLGRFVDDASAFAPKNPALLALKGKVTGALGCKAAFQGLGLSTALLRKNMTAQGSFYLKDGVIRKTQWQEALAAAIPHEPTRRVIEADIIFSNLVADFSRDAERLNLKNLTLGSGEDWRGGDLFLQAGGFLAADGSLDFKVIPHFNPAKLRLEGVLADGFNDKAGWPTYDYIAYYGPAGKAKADFKAGLQNAAKKAVQKQVDRKVEEIKKQTQDLLQQKAGEALKGLFGR